jgi:antirestriction protein ArdC
MSRDIYSEVTDKLVAAIETDPGDPIMPWHRGGANAVPHNALTDHEYQGVNILNLWVVGQASGFTSNVWGTYKQWQALGAQVRKGEKSTPVVFYKQVVKRSEESEKGEDEIIRILKYSTTFNADQVDDWQPPAPTSAITPPERLEAVDTVVTDTGAHIIERGASAYYRPATDTVHMPDPARFFDTQSGTRTENFYAVLLHELTHWTGHPTRCDRDLLNRFGSEAYAMEELIAELGAAFLCARLGISPTPRDDHAQYLANWLKVLKLDNKAIFTAAAKAQAAVDHIL